MRKNTMKSGVYSFKEVDGTMLAMVGGKGANLGELARLGGLEVPDGFCISTEAFKRIIAENGLVKRLLDALAVVKLEERDKISKLAGEIRGVIEGIDIPMDITDEVVSALSRLDGNETYAVRSSATAEDLPTASFAGQQDTYLNVMGKESVLKHISKCWASLFTDRAIIYRIQNGFDHRKVYLGIVVQKMIFPQASGIMFTADPITSNRKVVSIDASFGLGEALVSGLVNADVYKVREGKIVDKKISAKKLAFYGKAGGGSEEYEVSPELQNVQALTDEQILLLEQMGRRIEEHFGRPQDIEWCLGDGVLHIVQSRPITTLFPIPEVNDQQNHVYLSFGHQQMMTDAMRPLGISVWRATSGRPMYEAGGRLFVDVAPDLASPARREVLVNVLGKSDPLMKDALQTVIALENFITLLPEEETVPLKGAAPLDFRTRIEYDPTLVPELVRNSQAVIDELTADIAKKSGVALVEFILDDLQKLKKSISDPRSFGVLMTAMNATTWLNEKMQEWLGEKGVADTLTLSAPNNVTSEMGLELLDVADVIRSFPEVVEYLKQVKEGGFLEGLDKVEGGELARDVIYTYLNKYGMRCAGEVDITKTRWSEKPAILVPLILNNIKNFEPGASHRRFEQGRQHALQKEQEILERLRQLADGEEKAEEAARMIELVRNYIGYREYPKYHIVTRYFVYKQALLNEAERLVAINVLHDKEDIYYLTLDELREAIMANKLDHGIVDKRRNEFKAYEKLTPPRVITSDGEIINGVFNRDEIPDGAFAGLAVSSGVIEGRARVVINMEDAVLEEGDILVTKFTDPSWTPLFVGIKGLVTEVGGLMTHGSVIAREYGLPAVVGVANATQLIKDGQQIRVNGTEGYVEIV